MANKKCSSCYDLDCNECILIHMDKDGNFDCQNYISKSEITKKLSEQLYLIENNPQILFEEPSVK